MIKPGQSYEAKFGSRFFRIESVEPETVWIKEASGLRLINRTILEMDLENGEIKLRGEGKHDGQTDLNSKSRVEHKTNRQVSGGRQTRKAASKKSKTKR